jgi:hypothetical protein
MIFISYAWADASDTAQLLHQRLAQAGHNTWIDFERLDLQCCLEEQLRHAIQTANAFLLIASPEARRSRWVRFEIACAKQAGIPFVVAPVKNLNFNRSETLGQSVA